MMTPTPAWSPSTPPRTSRPRCGAASPPATRGWWSPRTTTATACGASCTPTRSRGAAHRRAGRPIGALVADALIVPETKPLDDLLADLQRQRTVDGGGGRRVRPGRGHRDRRGHHRGGRGRDRRRDRPARRRRAPAGQRRLVRPRARRGHRPRRLRPRAARRHRRLQLGGRLRVRRARPAPAPRRHRAAQRLLHPRRVGAREPGRGGAHPASRRRAAGDVRSLNETITRCIRGCV